MNEIPVGPATAASIYVRRSSRQDLGKNQSLQEQETDCRRLAASLGLSVVEVYLEREGTGASRRSAKARPEWKRALHDLDSGERFHTLIVWSLDRADRRGADTLAALLTKHAATGRRILGLDGTDTSDERQRLVTIIRGEIAREEAENTAKRVLRTKASRRAEGSWLGGSPPYGLMIADGKVAPDPVTAPTARFIAEQALAGRSLWALARELQKQGIPSPKGGTWTVGSLSALLRSPAFAGLQSVRRRSASGAWPAIADVYLDPDSRQPVSVGEGIISPTERSLILATLASRSSEYERGVVRGRKGSSTITGGLLRCDACGSRSSASSSSNGGSYRCAAMARGLDCDSPFTAPRVGVDEYVARRFLSYLAALEPGDGRLDRIAERWAVHVDPTSAAERAEAQSAVDAVEADLARARRLAVSGVLTEEEAAAEISRLRTLLKRAGEALGALPRPEVDVSPLLDLVESAEAWEALPGQDRRDLLTLAIREVRVSRASGRGVRFDPSSRVSIAWID
ncbi:recombinase family protein [Arthrobacter zhaoguopingii]|uniref:recombinase family protein n=1 Tax=Arthrobacter zhaoguopingii TaxID=2681491 RepID=UPI001359561C|nr:recombinase family protein [Arthrobacter zhaoguopingii]